MIGKQHRTHHPKLAASIAWSMLAAVCLFAPEAALAQAGGTGPWSGVLQQIIDIMTGTPARLLAIIVVAALGFAALFGRMSFSWAGSIIGGITLIFGAAAIVDIFQGSVS